MGASAGKPEPKPVGGQPCPDISESLREAGLDHQVLGRYVMSVRKKDTLGEGSFSVCYRGTDIETGEAVAIKVVKANRDGRSWARPDAAMLQRFRRQVSVLRELQEPFPEHVDPTLWNEKLSSLRPSDIFLRLLDYSRDASGEPGPDPRDGGLYVVTELADYSFKDLLDAHIHTGRQLPREATRTAVASVLLSVACLHAKGFVHMDIKPSNLMVFEGRLKLIDIDGCVRAGTPVFKSDPSISFSPCYCAPEFGRFLTRTSGEPIEAMPGLDAWSTGMVLCEAVHLSEVLWPMIEGFQAAASSEGEAAGYLFMEWLGRLETVSLPRTVQEFDPELRDLISNRLLVSKASQRATPAQCLSHAYVSRAHAAWSFPTWRQLLELGGADVENMDATLVRATARLVREDREAGDEPMKRRASWQSTRASSKASRTSSKSSSAVSRLISAKLKLVRRPSQVLDRSMQVFKSLLSTMVAADLKGAPTLRCAFDDA